MTSVAVVVPLGRPERAEDVIAQWKAQTVMSRLVLAATDFREPWAYRARRSGAEVVHAPPSIGGARNAGTERARELGADWAAYWDDDNRYLPRYLEGVLEADAGGHGACTRGLGVVRDGDGLWLLDGELTYLPGHSSAVRLSLPPPRFPETSDGQEEIAWSGELRRRGASVLLLPPWGLVYDRTGGGHADPRPWDELVAAHGPARLLGRGLPDSAAASPIEAGPPMNSDEAVFRRLEGMSRLRRGA